MAFLLGRPTYNRAVQTKVLDIWASYSLCRSMAPRCGEDVLTWREVRAGGGGMLSGNPGTGIGEDGRGGNTKLALEGVVGVGALGSALPCAAAALRPARAPRQSHQAWRLGYPPLQGRRACRYAPCTRACWHCVKASMHVYMVHTCLLKLHHVRVHTDMTRCVATQISEVKPRHDMLIQELPGGAPVGVGGSLTGAAFAAGASAAFFTGGGGGGRSGDGSGSSSFTLQQDSSHDPANTWYINAQPICKG